MADRRRKTGRQREPVRSDFDEVSAVHRSAALLTGGKGEASSGRGGTDNAAPAPTATTAVHAKPAKGELAATDSHRRATAKKDHLSLTAAETAILVFLMIAGVCLVAAVIGMTKVTIDAYGNTVDLTPSSVTGGQRPKDLTDRNRVPVVLGYRLSSDAPIISDFTIPPMGDADDGDPGDGQRYLSTEIIFKPDRPCPDEATLTWAWTGPEFFPLDQPARTMTVDQVAVLTDVHISGDTPRFSASISSPTLCSGSLELVGSRVRDSNFYPHERYIFFKKIEIRK